MRIQEYPFTDVQCASCGWTDGGTLTLTPAEPDDRYEDYELEAEVSASRCGRCGADLLADTVVPRERRPRRALRVRKPIRDRRHRCARAGVAV